jgi:hypothetical protein
LIHQSLLQNSLDSRIFCPTGPAKGRMQIALELIRAIRGAAPAGSLRLSPIAPGEWVAVALFAGGVIAIEGDHRGLVGQLRTRRGGPALQADLRLQEHLTCGVTASKSLLPRQISPRQVRMRSIATTTRKPAANGPACASTQSPQQQQRPFGVAQHAGGGGADQEFADARVVVGAHYQQIT